MTTRMSCHTKVTSHSNDQAVVMVLDTYQTRVSWGCQNVRCGQVAHLADSYLIDYRTSITHDV